MWYWTERAIRSIMRMFFVYVPCIFIVICPYRQVYGLDNHKSSIWVMLYIYWTSCKQVFLSCITTAMSCDHPVKSILNIGIVSSQTESLLTNVIFLVAMIVVGLFHIWFNRAVSYTCFKIDPWWSELETSECQLITDYMKIKLNTLRPRRNCHHFTDDIFKCFFLNEKV